MVRLVSFVVVPLALAAPLAFAAPEAILPRLPLSLALTPQEQVCANPAGMQPWHDASDPLFFATGATARLDEHELWAGALTPLAALRFQLGVLHLVVVGMPQTRIGFSLAGWRPRWPLC